MRAPSLNDLHEIAANIKNTLLVVISDLREDIHDISARVGEMERTAAGHDASLCQVQQVTESHAIHMRELHHHLEDLDNGGRPHNLRVKGIPENIEPKRLAQATKALFNDLLERSQDAPIEMERIHRVLRPRGRDTDPTWDVVCCLVSFPQKEEILRKARNRGRLMSHGAEVKIYQDLSNITLQHRKELRPLLDLLHSKSKFPFCLSATNQGRTANLRVPEDVDHFATSWRFL